MSEYEKNTINSSVNYIFDMKILFYDVKDFELNYFLERVSNNLGEYFLKTTLNECTYIDKKYLDAQGISCFVNSQLDKKVLSKFKNLKYIFLNSHLL